MAKRGSSDSLGVDVHERVRADILRGEWEPGDRLSPGALAARYQASTTVVREALTRLAGQKFVALEPNRGFFVPRLRLAELEDVTLFRSHVESLALRLSIERGDLTWESELIACHHQLTRTPRRLPDAPDRTNDAWSNAHWAFHAKLIEACRIPALLDVCSNLFDATELYRRWSAPQPGGSSRDVEAEHAGIVDAVLARDVELATARLSAHYEKTVETLLAAGLVDGAAATTASAKGD